MTDALIARFLTISQLAAGDEGEPWPERFREWYVPAQWFGIERALAVWIGCRVRDAKQEGE